ncbi:MAG TPA: DNA gyrase subunit A, partial [Thermomicrobiaceae bacterium]|nr:DNA gyrase subunit A [Thermomicrobiaceae bacterium]
MSFGTVRPVDIESEMRRSYLDYAMSVIVQRALPDVRDGLKPVQRRILYAMHEMGIRANSKTRKSAGIVGEVLKSYHPHNDVAVYDALVRMVQPFSLRYPLVEGQGNFGSVDGDSAAAMRYTETRLSAMAEQLLADIERQTVDFQPNYDGETREPKVLPGRLPNLLVNGASGIAVGMATNVPPHNLAEVCDGLVYLIDNPEATIDELTEIIPGPDFPTGGIILGREGIRAAYATGKGRVVIRARATIEEAPRGNRFHIIVTELPYQVNKAALIEKIAEYVKAGRIDGIHDLRDESDRTGMRVVVELKREAQPHRVLNALFKHTQLQQTFGVNMLALVDGTQPRVLTLKRALQLYLDHREEVVRRRTEFDLVRARRRAHILEGLKIALDHLDEVIATIRASRSADDARQNVMVRFGLTEVQSNAILEMQLRRLAALERRKIEDEYREVLREIATMEDLLADQAKIRGVIRDELVDLKDTFGDTRRTVIQDMSGEIRDEDLIPDISVLVMLSTRGYVKRIPDGTYRTQRRGGRGVTGMTLRDEDGVQRMTAANTHDSLLFFTDRGRVFQLKVHELPDAGRTAKGTPVVNLIGLQRNETITTLLPVQDFGSAAYLFMCTRNGRVKRTRLDQFSSVRSSGLIAIGLDDDDELAWVRMTSGDDEIILVTEHGQAIRFDENVVRAMGRPAAGVIGIRMEDGDRVIGAEVVQPDADLLVVSQNGFGKRTPLTEFRVTNRGGAGVTAIRRSERNGLVAAARVVNATDTIMLVSTRGMVIRIPAGQVSCIGRTTQGVAIMRLQESDQVASLTLIRTAEDEEIADLEEASAIAPIADSPNGHDQS